MKLNTLLMNITNNANESIHHIDIEGISTNSSSVRPNELFVAIPGYSVDGHAFIEDAIKAGASVVVGEKDLKGLTVPYIRVSNSRFALAKMACQFYETPSKKRIIVGITGTNGKTTTSFMLKHILESSGRTCSLFGSVMNIVNGQVSPAVNTTLGALELQRQLALSKDEIIIIEVSSHGLSQYRVGGMEFDYCLFTNLDHDHLDYHRDMEEYFSVKASLFDQLKPDGKAIINHYNSWGMKLADRLKLNGCNIYTLGEERYCDLRIDKFISEEINSAVVLEQNKSVRLKLNILGKHNIFNASMAYLTGRELGLESSKIIHALEKLRGVPGRFEVMQHPKGATIVIDYAHTPDALYHCLQTAKEKGAERIFHIFGFRGNRDTEKRREMVSISQEMSDASILTLDDLNGISYEDMEKDLHKLNLQQKGFVIPDRTMAIKCAWDQVDEGDWVFITGKGSEAYQQQYHLPTASDKETVQYLSQ
ncbi:UDP-N-acetylmuramoyl-L-alanyl-D-glutamate--2,6-diaminopimelate ligase [Bacillus aerolatus]|nr:UDP-N-acetylmuramoyl-L-alanyl-D-glutamate--2,6-diaminopimelate ligase [Bacillus aerolatus]